MATCGNCQGKHSVQGVRACYAARYRADAPRGYVATAPSPKARAAQPPAPVLAPAPVSLPADEAEALERRRQAAANLAGLRSRVRRARAQRATGMSVTEALRTWSERQGEPDSTPAPF